MAPVWYHRCELKWPKELFQGYFTVSKWQCSATDCCTGATDGVACVGTVVGWKEGEESARTSKGNIAAKFPLWTSEFWKNELLGPPN